MKLTIPDALLKILAAASGQAIEGADAQKNFETAIEVFIALGTNSAATAKERDTALQRLTELEAQLKQANEGYCKSTELLTAANATITKLAEDIKDLIESEPGGAPAEISKLIADATGLPLTEKSTEADFVAALRKLVEKAGTVDTLTRILNEKAPQALLAHDPYQGPRILTVSQHAKLPPHHQAEFARLPGTVTTDPAPKGL